MKTLILILAALAALIGIYKIVFVKKKITP